MDIFGMTCAEFASAFTRSFAKGAHYSSAVYRQVMKTGRTDLQGLDAFARYPDLARQVKTQLVVDCGCMVRQATDGGVTKFATRLRDGLEIETVVIPMFNRRTVCVSSQVGCRMGCRFCETGKLGLLRNLTAAEIVGQVFNVRFGLGMDVRNVVFMGMGEPLDNLENVIQAIRVLEDQRGLDIARRHITVSTVGLAEGIDRLAAMDGSPVNLAVSLNAPNDDIRSQIMPVNRAIPMDRLKRSLQRYPLTKKSALFVEYVLIRGLNDQLAHAEALAEYLSPLKVKLNLIPCNPVSGSGFSPPAPEDCQRFHARLVSRKLFVRWRGARGHGILAACGQLGQNPGSADVGKNM